MRATLTVLKAADVAARWHVGQRRKGATGEPYVQPNAPEPSRERFDRSTAGRLMTTEPDNLTRKMDETLNRVAEDSLDLLGELVRVKPDAPRHLALNVVFDLLL